MVTIAIVKLTKSKKAVQFIDDEGNVFMTSTKYFKTLMAGNMKYPLILLNRLPLKANKNRFKKSPLWNPSGLVDSSESIGTDSLSKTGLQDVEDNKTYNKDLVKW